MSKTGVADFDDLQGTPLKPLLSERFLDIMDHQYRKLMLDRLWDSIRYASLSIMVSSPS